MSAPCENLRAWLGRTRDVRDTIREQPAEFCARRWSKRKSPMRRRR